jgi:NADPH:quinone reductase-like Zn-dependent oxidoreductase
MRAVAIDAYGEPQVARLRELSDPRPGPGEVVVRMRAAALNHLDLWTTSGSLGIDIRFPFILGADGSGEIETVGDQVEDLEPGTRVLINPAVSCRACERCRVGQQSECSSFQMLGEHLDGTFAELVRVPASNVFPVPPHLSFVEAAALGVTFITAYRMLFTQGEMRPGEWVLITGIGGGLALSLLQLARPLAGRIFVTSSSDDKLQKAMELGADEGINYRNEDVAKAIRRLTWKRGVDLVMDSAGGPSLEGSLRSLVQGGRIVISGATAGRTSEIDLRRLFWKQLRIIGSTMGSDADVAGMLRMVQGAQLRPVIDQTFRLSEAAEALAQLGSQKQFGKIALEIS